MFLLNENEREYRFKDSGPKYLMKGPRSNFAVVQFMPGQDFEAHNLKAGDFIHIEPGEVHYCVNNYDVPIKMVSTLAPYQEVDKVVVEGYDTSKYKK